ncbi:hypothetical protein [Streptomyces griseoluteus]|uniref:hypothetical protein n=1 Tax=Streptomyces griseoluteus TaxID=29306 RepID=UPI0034422369
MLERRKRLPGQGGPAVLAATSSHAAALVKAARLTLCVGAAGMTLSLLPAPLSPLRALRELPRAQVHTTDRTPATPTP